MKVIIINIFIIVFLSGISLADTRIYQQSNDVTLKSNGEASIDKKKGNLFRLKYDVDMKNKIIKRIHVERLDNGYVTKDDSEYLIVDQIMVLNSNGGFDNVIFAYGRPGLSAGEILFMSDDYLYTSRVGGTSMSINANYIRLK
ncbi:MAG TPA: hypothetical protein DCP51_00370 [Clostridiales bacterium]|nr:MAG: hypothetical protein A2X42_04085 [Candidatus Margulisbacteria bacterium GWF2_38_17]OGI07164.1 MAG: hypothetical protein A2X41_06155 [Candidatus Margulisbacteria bacterium GWE2_39_32]HAN20128.1 hypothetical protein [Clostridiales bacterium]HCT84721.1 hypothetical protein [Candidatus Margulisiibacteriota bacterium]